MEAMRFRALLGLKVQIDHETITDPYALVVVNQLLRWFWAEGSAFKGSARMLDKQEMITSESELLLRNGFAR